MTDHGIYGTLNSKLVKYFIESSWRKLGPVMWVIQKDCRVRLNDKIRISYFVTFQHNVLQLKCTLSGFSPKLEFHYRIIADLALPAGHFFAYITSSSSMNLHFFMNSLNLEKK